MPSAPASRLPGFRRHRAGACGTRSRRLRRRKPAFSSDRSRAARRCRRTDGSRSRQRSSRPRARASPRPSPRCPFRRSRDRTSFPFLTSESRWARHVCLLRAARALRLHRRALDRAERAEDAAVAGSGLEQRPALGALVVELAGVGGHRFRLGVAAPWTSQNGLERSLAHGFGLDGKPAFAVAFVSASTLALASSKVTTASFFSKLTLTLETPGTLDSAFLTVIGHASQYIDGTSSATVFVSANDGAARPVSATTDRSLRILIGVPFSVKERCDIREDEDGEQPRRYDPEADPVASPDPRHGANSAGLAGRGPVEAPPGPPERRERDGDEHGLIRLERLQIRDPCAAEAQGDDYQRTEAASAGQQGGDAARGEGGGLGVLASALRFGFPGHCQFVEGSGHVHLLLQSD